MATKFKSAHVGKSSNLTEEIEKLPEDLKIVWRKRQFNHFLERFNNILSSPPLTDDKQLEPRDLLELYTQDIIQILPFLSELGHSFDREVHRLIRKCYELCDKLQHRPTELLQSLARSCNKYVLNILCTKKMELVPYRYPYRFITWCLNFSRDLNVLNDEIEQTLNVPEEELLEFVDKLYIYPLDSKFPKRPGVYLIYHVGKTELYKGSQVSPSTHHPVYVGMSRKNIADRIRDHKNKIESAKNLHLTDFVVRFMIVTGSAPAIEKKLIEYYSPVWNSRNNNCKTTVGFAFGNGTSKTNKWNKFHVQEDEKTIVTTLEQLRIS